MRCIRPRALKKRPQQWNAVADKNKKLELLVYGKFALGEDDALGHMAYHWLTKAAILEMGFDEAGVQQAVEEHLEDLRELYL